MNLSNVHDYKNTLKQADCLYTKDQIEEGLDRIATEITQKLEFSHPIVMAVMTGALIPLGHLLTRLHFPLEIDYVHATRYKDTTIGGDLQWLVQPRSKLKDRTILVFDDVFDGGLTLSAILDYCKLAGAKKVYSAVMVNKRRSREDGVTSEPDFVGLNTDDRYIFGFGLDYENHFRNLFEIYAMKT